MSSLPRFFIDAALEVGCSFQIPRDVARHIAVRRLNPGEKIILFNGVGGEFSATLRSATSRDWWADVDGHAMTERELPFRFVLAQGIVSSEKMDWIVEKTVELGVSSLVPLSARRSVVRLSDERLEKRTAHWRNIIKAASEQCGRNTLATLLPTCTVESFVQQPHPKSSSAHRLVAMPSATLTLSAWLQQRQNLVSPEEVILMIGPEGGFAAEEELAIRTAGYVPVSLGSRVLRAETAGIAALAMLQGVLGH